MLTRFKLHVTPLKQGNKNNSSQSSKSSDAESAINNSPTVYTQQCKVNTTDKADTNLPDFGNMRLGSPIAPQVPQASSGFPTDTGSAGNHKPGKVVNKKTVTKNGMKTITTTTTTYIDNTGNGKVDEIQTETNTETSAA